MPAFKSMLKVFSRSGIERFNSFETFEGVAWLCKEFSPWSIALPRQVVWVMHNRWPGLGVWRSGGPETSSRSPQALEIILTISEKYHR